MKVILQVLPSFNMGGTEYETLDTANFLAKNGYKSIVLSAGGSLVEKLDKSVIHITNKFIKSKNIFLLIYNIWLIKTIIKKYDINLIHVRSRAPAWACFFAIKSFSNIKYVTSFHGLYGMQNCFKKFYNSIMVRSQKIIAVSNFCKEYILQYYPEVKNKIVTVYSWVDEKKTDLNIDYIGYIRNYFKIPLNSKIIFLPGRLSSAKGHKFWLQAMSKIKEPNIVCLTMGANEPLRHKLKKFAKTLNFQHPLIFIPYTDNMPSLYSMADLIVCPSIKPESFGKTVVEACLMQKPVIATNLGSFKETIVNNKTGWLVENGDIENFANKIKEVLFMNFEEKNKITLTAHKYVLKNFTSSAMLHNIVKVYDSLL